jgi:prephenate dehydrogenase
MLTGSGALDPVASFSMTDFSKVTILGGGLLGGSLALALPLLENPPAVRLWARRSETVTEAEKLGIPGVTSDLSTAVRDADLIILAVPVGAMTSLVEKSLAAGVSTNCLFTDVGSVKSAPHQTVGTLLADRGIPFIGSHPMAGSEKNGLSAARADLFQNAACLLTNDQQIANPLVEALDRFWRSIGCRNSWMDAADHDRLVARISHLPHILAASGARICLEQPADGKFGGGGLRDTTRVAGGNPEMWAEILLENRSALLAPLRETLSDLSEILASLEKGDHEMTRQWLATAKQRRDTLNPLR